MALKSVNAPSRKQLEELSEKFGIPCTDEELYAFHANAQKTIVVYEKLNAIPDPPDLLPVLFPRIPGRRPLPSENKLGAWYWKTEIKGADEGPLSGLKVAMKDNIAVAGVPMMNGSRVLEGYVPEYDATVVKRTLQAGGTIIGKTTCEDLCLSGASYSTRYGPVRNPWDHAYSAGGSSSGSGVVVATGEADLALGGDQGGSIRIPASSCGIVGLKPTYGLVPYTGIVPIEATMDHVGPMARTVALCRKYLQVLAGYDDDKDPRQFELKHKTFSIQANAILPSHIRIGILTEGFKQSSEDIQNLIFKIVKSAYFVGMFKEVKDVSVPAHSEYASLLPMPLINEAATQYYDDGFWGNMKGVHSTSLEDKFSAGMKLHASELSVSTKYFYLLGKFLREQYGYHFLPKTRNLIYELKKNYDKIFEEVDVLLMPTLTKLPNPIPTDGMLLQDALGNCCDMIANTCPFNLTGHPALTLNAGWNDSNVGTLPVGLQLVGRCFEDGLVLDVAEAIEQFLSAPPHNLGKKWPSILCSEDLKLQN